MTKTYDDQKKIGFTDSSSFPDWTCKNCHKRYPPDTPLVKCSKPGCGAQLVRWKRYQEKIPYETA